MSKNQNSPRYIFFLGLTALLVLVNLLIANDYVTIWETAEADFILQVQANLQTQAVDEARSLSFLPELVAEWLYQFKGFNIAYLRYISVIVLLLSFLGIYHWGRKIFGEAAVILTMVVAGSGLLLVNISKMVVADVWLFATQSLFLIFLILYIKQPLLKWLVAATIMLVLGLTISLPAMLIWGMGLTLYFYLLHERKANVQNILLKSVLPVSVLGLIIWFTQGPWRNDGFIFAFGNISYGKYLLFTFLAMLPWLGFLIAGLVDVFMKIKKREELAIISLGWLLFGLASMSLVVQLLFAYLIAKHVVAFLRKPYPYDGLVKSISLFGILLTFIAITMFLIGGWQQLGEGGYQSALSISALYWTFGFVGVLGLFLMDKKLVVGGFALSTLLFTFAFWGKVYPLIEKFRSLPQELVKESTKQAGGQEIPLTVAMETLKNRKNFKVYANAHFQGWQTINDQAGLEKALTSASKSLIIVNQTMPLQIDSLYLKSGKTITGNIDINKMPAPFLILKTPLAN